MESAFGVAVQEKGRHEHGINARVDNSLMAKLSSDATDIYMFSKLVVKKWPHPPFPTLLLPFTYAPGDS